MLDPVSASVAAQSGLAEQSCWSNLLWPDPAARAPKPAEALTLTWEGPGLAVSGANFTGPVFSDGSAYDAKTQGLARAGGAVVQGDARGACVTSAWAPLPGWIQTTPLAELFFATVAIRHACPPLDLVTDCEGIIKGLKGGKEKATAERKLYGPQWSLLFRLLEDLTWAIWEQRRPDQKPM